LFAAQSDQDRLRSVLVDMTKTSSDFRAAASKALEALADGLLPKLRPIMDELGAVRLTTLLADVFSHYALALYWLPLVVHLTGVARAQVAGQPQGIWLACL
jgi:hypothetical protein